MNGVRKNAAKTQINAITIPVLFIKCTVVIRAPVEPSASIVFINLSLDWAGTNKHPKQPHIRDTMIPYPVADLNAPSESNTTRRVGFMICPVCTISSRLAIIAGTPNDNAIKHSRRMLL